MKTLKIPFIADIQDLPLQEMEVAMATQGARAYIDTVCWPDSYPYAPDISFSIARSRTHLAILYRNRGLDLRAQALEDNGKVWEDSCCEFFVSHPSDGTYYNFELNCIGTLLAAKRTGKTDADHFNRGQLDRIIRHSSLEHVQREENGRIFEWQTALCIPMDLIGVDGTNPPESLRANFYKCADLSAHPHFLSWNPVEVPQPDFHRPEFFGKLYF